jgi:polysaccharide export outer membrane protein
MRFYLSILFILAVTILQSNSQDMPSSLSDISELQKAAKKTGLQQLPESPALERPVDVSTYMLGPGDVLSIIIGGQADEEYQLMVTPEGAIVLPSVGSIPVADKTMAEAKIKISERIGSKYIAEEVSITLLQLRSFRVTVSGAVNFPGLVTVNALQRVSDAITQAGGIIEPPPPIARPEDPRKQKRAAQKPKIESELSEEEIAELEKQVGSKRNIMVKRWDGEEIHADLQKYELAGDLDANPQLLDGDVIVVPTEQKETGRVSISGAVKTPGEFEYASGDRVSDLLAMAHGYAAGADSTHISIVRFDGQADRVKDITLDLDWQNQTQTQAAFNTLLEPDDRIYVRFIPHYHRKRNIEIQGEVLYPGEFALESDGATLSQVIELAGGFTDSADLRNAHIIRRSHEDIKDPEFERLDLMMVSDMTKEERQYYQAKMRERKGRIPVDFVALFEKNNKTQDVVLRDEDLIVIPLKEKTVNVMGQVIQPGLYEWEPNQDAKYYIKLAGGYNHNAWKRKARVIKASSGQMLKTGDTDIEMGDTVYVPATPEKNYWAVVRDIVSISVQIATIYLLIQSTKTQ